MPLLPLAFHAESRRHGGHALEKRVMLRVGPHPRLRHNTLALEHSKTWSHYRTCLQTKTYTTGRTEMTMKTRPQYEQYWMPTNTPRTPVRHSSSACIVEEPTSKRLSTIS